MPMSTSTDVAVFSGVQKAAALLLQLGKDHAAKVMAHMNEAEVEELAAEIVRMQSVPREQAQDVLVEFYTVAKSGGDGSALGGISAARALLEGTVGKARANSIMDRVSMSPGSIPFAFLREADGRQLQNFLSEEHPQTIALVVAHLRTDQASAVMSGLSQEVQGEVAQRIAQMDGTSPEVIRSVAEVLHRRASSSLTPKSAETAEVGGVQPLVDIINRADAATEKSILQGLEERDKDLAEEIRGQMFVFEDMLGLEDRAIQLVLRNVESGILAKSLKGASEAVNNKILKNVSSRAREAIEEEIELMGRMRMSEIEEARGLVVAAVRQLEASGEIVLRNDEEDEYVA